MNNEKIVEYIFDRLRRKIINLGEVAQMNRGRFNTDEMKAFYQGEMLGYERINYAIDYIKSCIKDEIKSCIKEEETE